MFQFVWSLLHFKDTRNIEIVDTTPIADLESTNNTETVETIAIPEDTENIKTDKTPTSPENSESIKNIETVEITTIAEDIGNTETVDSPTIPEDTENTKHIKTSNIPENLENTNNIETVETPTISENTKNIEIVSKDTENTENISIIEATNTEDVEDLRQDNNNTPDTDILDTKEEMGNFGSGIKKQKNIKQNKDARNSPAKNLNKKKEDNKNMNSGIGQSNNTIFIRNSKNKPSHGSTMLDRGSGGIFFPENKSNVQNKTKQNFAQQNWPRNNTRNGHFNRVSNITKNSSEMQTPKRADNLEQQTTKILQKIDDSKNQINTIVSKAKEYESKNAIKTINDEMDKITVFRQYCNPKVDVAVSSGLKVAKDGIEEITKQKLLEIQFEIEKIGKEVEEIRNNEQKQSEILDNLKRFRKEILVFSNVEHYSQLSHFNLNKINELTQKIRNDQKNVTQFQRQMQEIRRKVNICNDSTNTEIKMELELLQQNIITKVHNRGNMKILNEEISELNERLVNKLNEIQIEQANSKIFNIRSKINEVAVQIKTDNFVDDQRKIKEILKILTQCEKDLGLITLQKNGNTIRKSIESLLKRINVLTEKIHTDLKTFTELNNALDEIKKKIENFTGTSEDSFFKDTNVSLKKLTKTIETGKIYNSYISGMLTSKTDKCFEILQEKLKKSEEVVPKIKGKLSRIILQLTDVSKKINEDDIFDNPQKLANILKQLKEDQKEMQTWAIPKSEDLLSETVKSTLCGIDMVIQKINNYEKFFSEFRNELQEIETETGKDPKKLEDTLFTEAECRLNRLRKSVVEKNFNHNTSKALNEIIDKCANVLKVAKELKVFNLTIINVSKSMKEKEIFDDQQEILQLWETLKQTRKVLQSISVPENMEVLSKTKEVTLRDIKTLMINLKNDQNYYSKFRNDLQRIEAEVKKPAVSFDETFFSKTEAALNSIRETVANQVYNNHVTVKLTIKIDNCSETLKSTQTEFDQIRKEQVTNTISELNAIWSQIKEDEIFNDHQKVLNMLAALEQNKKELVQDSNFDNSSKAVALHNIDALIINLKQTKMNNEELKAKIQKIAEKIEKFDGNSKNSFFNKTEKELVNIQRIISDSNIICNIPLSRTLTTKTLLCTELLKSKLKQMQCIEEGNNFFLEISSKFNGIAAKVREDEVINNQEEIIKIYEELTQIYEGMVIIAKNIQECNNSVSTQITKIKDTLNENQPNYTEIIKEVGKIENTAENSEATIFAKIKRKLERIQNISNVKIFNTCTSETVLSEIVSCSKNIESKLKQIEIYSKANRKISHVALEVEDVNKQLLPAGITYDKSIKTDNASLMNEIEGKLKNLEINESTEGANAKITFVTSQLSDVQQKIKEDFIGNEKIISGILKELRSEINSIPLAKTTFWEEWKLSKLQEVDNLIQNQTIYTSFKNELEEIERETEKFTGNSEDPFFGNTKNKLNKITAEIRKIREVLISETLISRARNCMVNLKSKVEQFKSQKLSSISSEIDKVEKQIKEDNIWQKEIRANILEILEQNKKELDTFEKSVDSPGSRIDLLQQKFDEDLQKFRKYTNELNEIRRDIKKFEGNAEDIFFNDTQQKLFNIQKSIRDEIYYNSQVSTALLGKRDKYSEMLETKHLLLESNEGNKSTSDIFSKYNIKKQDRKEVNIVDSEKNRIQKSQTLSERNKKGPSTTIFTDIEVPEQSAIIKKGLNNDCGNEKDLVDDVVCDTLISETIIEEGETGSTILKPKLKKAGSEGDVVEHQLKKDKNLRNARQNVEQEKKELFAITDLTNTKHFKKRDLNKTEMLNDKVNGGQKSFEEINRKLNETKRKIEKFYGSSTDTFLNDLAIELEKIQDTVSNKVLDKYFSKTLTKKREDCSKLLESKLRQIQSIEVASRKISSISAQVDKIEKQLNDEKIAKILEILEHAKKELSSVETQSKDKNTMLLETLPQKNIENIDNLKKRVLSKIIKLSCKVNKDQETIEKISNELQQTKIKIEECDVSSNNAFFNKMKIKLKNIQDIVINTVQNKPASISLSQEREDCSRFLESKLNEIEDAKTEEKILTISLQINRIEKQIEHESMTNNLDILLQAEKALHEICIPTDTETKKSALSKTKKLIDTIMENQRTSEEISNDLEQTKRQIEEFEGNSKNEFFNKMRIKLTNVQDTINNKVHNKPTITILTMERKNCSRILKSKLKQIEISEANEKIITISAQIDLIEKQIEEECLTNILERLLQKEKELTEMSDMEITKSVLHKIKNLTETIKENQRASEEISNELKQIKIKIEEFVGSSKDALLSDMAIKLKDIEETIDKKVHNKPISLRLTIERDNCSRILESKWKEIKFTEANGKMLTISLEIDRFEKELENSNNVTNIENILLEKEKELRKIPISADMERMIPVANKMKTLIQKVKETQETFNKSCKDLAQIKNKIETFDGSSKDAFVKEVEMKLKCIKNNINKSVHNKPIFASLTGEIENCSKILQSKLMENKFTQISLEIDRMEKELENKYNATKVLKALLQKEKELSQMNVPTNMENLKKAVLNKIIAFTVNLRAHEEINRELDKIETKIQKVNGASRGHFYKNLEEELKNIQNKIIAAISSLYLSRILTRRMENCLALLKFTNIDNQLLNISKQIKEGEIFHIEEKIAEIFDILTQNMKEINSILIPTTSTFLVERKNKTTELYAFINKKFTGDFNNYCEFVNKLNQIEIQIQISNNWTESLFNDINTQLSNIETNATYKFYNIHVAQTLKSKIENCRTSLESNVNQFKKHQETIKKISEIQSEVEDIASTLEKCLVTYNLPTITQTLESIKEKREELDNLHILENEIAYHEKKTFLSNLIDEKIQKLQENQRIYEKFSKEIEDIKTGFQQFSGTSIDPYPNEINAKFNNLQKQITDKFTDYPIYQILRTELENCRKMMDSKLNELKLKEQSKIEENNTNYKISENKKMLNEAEENLNKVEVEVKNYLGPPTGDEYLKLETKLEESLKTLKSLKIEDDSGDAEEILTSLKEKARTTLLLLQQNSYTVEAIQQLERRLRRIENNVNENIQGLSDYQKEDIEEELHQIREKLERTTVIDQLNERKNDCIKLMKTLFLKLQNN